MHGRRRGGAGKTACHASTVLGVWLGARLVYAWAGAGNAAGQHSLLSAGPLLLGV